jgi:hypothetical protein
VFERDAVADGLALAGDLITEGRQLPYAGTIGALLAICASLEGAHQHTDPETGGPCALGALPLSSLQFEPDGSFWILGFGDPTLAREEALPGYTTAPELALTGQPTPETDILALATLMRSSVPFTDLPPVLRRILAGSPGTDTPLASFVYGLNGRIWGVPPALRPSLPTLRRSLESMFELLGVKPDLSLFHQSVRALLRERERLSPPASTPQLTVASDGSWFRFEAENPVELSSRTPLRRVLLCLLDAHEARIPSVVVWDLLEAGWPGEAPTPEAGANRVYAAIAALRRMGLREQIQRFEAGYRFNPGLSIVRQ